MILATLLLLAQSRPPGYQTILKGVDLHRDAPVRAFLNEKFLGILSKRRPIDLSQSVKPGRNTLVLKWQRPMSSLGVAVLHAQTTRFGVVAKVATTSASDPALRKAGSKRITFDLPARAVKRPVAARVGSSVPQ